MGPGSVLEWDEYNDQVVVRKAGRYTSADIHRALFPEEAPKKNSADVKDGIRKYIQKPEDCMKWYERAAQRGVDAARNSLAEAYGQGLFGVPVDKEKARYWKGQIGKPAEPQSAAAN